jgi:murein DD-endopeptidase MepM/ murein hydrolase activator NlpD
MNCRPASRTRQPVPGVWLARVWLARVRFAVAVAALAILLPVGARASEATGATHDVGPGSGSGFRFPVAGPAKVLTAFQPPATRYGPGHRGVDLALKTGSPVLAAGDGTVVFAGPLAGRGVISIDHPVGIRTTYDPVTALVRAGDRVFAGQVIGVLQAGHPSCAPAACVHWGARLTDGSYVDPMGLVSGVMAVRLLPWSGSP